MIFGGVAPSIAGYQLRRILLQRGVRQGRVESMVHFVLTVAVAMQGLVVEWKRSGIGLVVSGVWVGCLNYADDFAFLGRSIVDVHRMMNDTAATLSRIGLGFSFKPEKTAY
eukprot:11162940-Karenia_brevis.AAC.1